MSRIRVLPITEEYSTPPIDCGEDDIQQMMKEAYRVTILKQAMAYNVFLNDNIVGQFMFRMFQVNDVDYESGIGGHSVSCIKIQYLAIDKEWQNKGLGTETMKAILKYLKKYIDELPIRFVYIESVQNREQWYAERFAFVRLPGSVELRNPDEYVVPMCIDYMDHEKAEAYWEALA